MSLLISFPAKTYNISALNIEALREFVIWNDLFVTAVYSQMAGFLSHILFCNVNKYLIFSKSWTQKVVFKCQSARRV